MYDWWCPKCGRLCNSLFDGRICPRCHTDTEDIEVEIVLDTDTEED
ncbi:MAG: hypothetical protein J6S85_01565 [Methanobrevibacter sp.]|nr:hypothetical protein [Methanobrevibacter sp.]